MYGQFYQGVVPMRPEVEKSDFVGDDEVTYQMPTIGFECVGEVYDSESAFAWHEDSLFMMKDNRIVKFTEYNSHDVLLTDLQGQTKWIEGRLADCMGFWVENTDEFQKTRSYWIEEYDLDKLEKRKYKVILDSSSPIEWQHEYSIHQLLKGLMESNGTECVLKET